MSDASVIEKIMDEYDVADIIVSVSPSYWADIPGQFKAFIDRCTPWCNTHEPHASIRPGKKGYAIALRTGPNMPECERIIGSIEHFYGHLEIVFPIFLVQNDDQWNEYLLGNVCSFHKAYARIDLQIRRFVIA